jgi:acid phosphatase family membrane protein YuiD
MLNLAQKKIFDVERLFGAGGMPSSHTAFMVSGLTAVGRVKGVTSVEFAVMFAISAIVVYDALGVRYAAGQHAKAINKLNKYIDQIRKAEYVKLTFDDQEKKELKEMLGHTPLEVLGGAVLGFTAAFLLPVG